MFSRTFQDLFTETLRPSGPATTRGMPASGFVRMSHTARRAAGSRNESCQPWHGIAPQAADAGSLMVDPPFLPDASGAPSLSGASGTGDASGEPDAYTTTTGVREHNNNNKNYTFPVRRLGVRREDLVIGREHVM